MQCFAECSTAAGGTALRQQLAAEATRKPWLVLVSGLNGIRKTTAINSPWASEALEAAVADAYGIGYPTAPLSARELPCGERGFYRQLDYMIATLASEEFRALYTIVDDLELYATRKATIFAKYRGIAEILGVLLVQCAMERGMDVFAETSGRSAGSFAYIDYMAGQSAGGSGQRASGSAPWCAYAYRKLVLRFDVNDVAHAERSVTQRMATEVAEGRAALASDDHDALLFANRGGPYGAAVLRGVALDSSRVWGELTRDGIYRGALAQSAWTVASLFVEACDSDAGWALRAGEKTFRFALHPLPVVSVIVPAHNALRALPNGKTWLDECLASVAAQTYRGPLELSIYDDGSTDGTGAAIRAWAEKLRARGIRVVASGSRWSDATACAGGTGFARNCAVAQSTGQYLCFVDVDDALFPTRVERQLAVAQRAPNAIVGGGFVRSPAGSTAHYSNWANTISPRDIVLQQFRECTVLMPTWFLHRSVFDAVGGFPEVPAGSAEDLRFFLAHLRNGGEFLLFTVTFYANLAHSLTRSP